MQNWQNKSKTTSKESNSISKMMAQRDKNKIQEKKKKEFIELLKKPRTKEYMMFLHQKIELEKKIRDIEEQISDLDKDSEILLEDGNTSEIEVQETKSSLEDKTVSKWWETNQEEKSIETTPKWWETEENKEVVEEERSSTYPKWTDTVQLEEKVSWLNEEDTKVDSIKEQMEKMERKQELQRQREALLQEYEEISSQFEKQLPVPEKTIGIVYWGSFTEVLRKWGVISVPGTSYSSPQDLLDIAKPDSEEVAERWIKGDRALRTIDTMAVEIYMDVLCLIYDNGDVKVKEE